MYIYSLSSFPREAMKDYIKGLELEKQAEEAVMKVAKQGEPLDPEMLNPARKRQRLEVCNKLSSWV